MHQKNDKAAFMDSDFTPCLAFKDVSFCHLVSERKSNHYVLTPYLLTFEALDYRNIFGGFSCEFYAFRLLGH